MKKQLYGRLAKYSLKFPFDGINLCTVPMELSLSLLGSTAKFRPWSPHHWSYAHNILNEDRSFL
jgi:hypothetical protein